MVDCIPPPSYTEAFIPSTENMEYTGNEVAKVVKSSITMAGHTIRTCILDGIRMASVVDYVMLVRGIQRDQAGLYVRRMRLDVLDKSINMIDLKFGSARLKSAAVAATDLVKLTFKIASGARVATSIVDKWAETIARVEGGDETMVPEIEDNARLADANPDGPQAFFRESVDAELRADAKRAAKEIEGVAKRVRRQYAPTDVEFWCNKRFGNRRAEDILALAERAVGIATQAAIMNNPEALAARMRAEEVERTEAAKRETARLLYDQSVASQSLLHQIDVNFYLVKQLNTETTEIARCGPCVYFSIYRNFIIYGQTGISFNRRYGDGKLDDAIIEGLMLALPARDADDARILEQSWSRTIANLAMRRGKRERFVGDWAPFVRAITQWNADHAGRPAVCIVMPDIRT